MIWLALGYAYLVVFVLHLIPAFIVADRRGAVTCLIKFIVDVPVMLFGLIIVPIALLFRTPDDHLPKWAWLWDNSSHGADGDNFWISRCGNTFWCRYQWLALRNPTFNLGRHVLSITTSQPYTLQGDEVIGDKKASGRYWLRSGRFLEH